MRKFKTLLEEFTMLLEDSSKQLTAVLEAMISQLVEIIEMAKEGDDLFALKILILKLMVFKLYLILLFLTMGNVEEKTMSTPPIQQIAQPENVESRKIRNPLIQSVTLPVNNFILD